MAILGIRYWINASIHIHNKIYEKVYPPVIALFVCGIAKLLIGILVTDFNLISWHNYSGLVMVLASLQLAVGLLSKKIRRFLWQFRHCSLVYLCSHLSSLIWITSTGTMPRMLTRDIGLRSSLTISMQFDHR